MPHNYTVKLALDPIRQTLDAVATLTYKVKTDTDNLEFILHRELKVDEIKAKGLSRYSLVGPTAYPFASEAVIWRLEFAEPLTTGAETVLEFSYRGQLKEPIWQPWGVNRLTPEWVELGMYGPWFPWNPQGGSFSYEVKLLLNHPYAVAATGQLINLHEGHWRINSLEPMEDITITAAPNLKMLAGEAGRARLRIYHVEGEDLNGLHILSEESTWVLEFYQQWFADAGQDRSIDLVLAPRTLGGGYARPGLIVLSDIGGYSKSPGYRLFRFIAHEFAHLWWTGAPVDSWEDWLNESFAEFSSLVALREKYGEAALDEIIGKRKQDFSDLPPIRGLSRTGEKTYETLYFKGSWLLLDLEKLIGEDKMKELLRRRLHDSVFNTADFLHLLREIAGEHIATQFDQWLS